MTFWKWILAEGRALSLPLALFTALHAIYPLLVQAWPILGHAYVIPALNACVALTALFYRPNGPPLDTAAINRLSATVGLDDSTLRAALGVRHGEKWETRAHQAHTAVTQFMRCWTGVWITWALQYGLLAVWESPLAATLQSKGASTAQGVLETALYMTNTLMFLFCFLAMWAVTVDEQGDPDFKVAPYIGVTVVLMLIESFAAALSTHAGLTLDIINGVISAVILAMFVGRLENEYLGTPIVVLVSLYLYAAIQPLHFRTLDPAHPLQGDVILSTAFLLKVPLLLVVAWLLDTGKFLFYMARVRSIHDHVRGDWDSFRHIVGQ